MLEEVLSNRMIRINSTRFTDQMGYFNWTGKRGQAAKGRSDDLIMSLAIGCFVARPNGLHSQETGVVPAWNKAFLASICRDSRSISTGINNFGREQQQVADPFMPVHQGPAPSKPETYNGVTLKPGVRREQVAQQQMIYNAFGWLFS